MSCEDMEDERVATLSVLTKDQGWVPDVCWLIADYISIDLSPRRDPQQIWVFLGLFVAKDQCMSEGCWSYARLAVGTSLLQSLSPRLAGAPDAFFCRSDTYRLSCCRESCLVSGV